MGYADRPRLRAGAARRQGGGVQPRRLVNICFHGIGTPRRELEPGEARYWVGTELYHRLLDEVADRDDVRLSFDDGNVSDVEVGLPGLVERGLDATFFVLAGRLGSVGSLDADAVQELAAAGMAVGSHGMDHRSWRAMDEATAHRELVEARDRLADVVGSPVRQAALPLGRYDRRLLGRLRRAGYTRVHTSDRRPAAPDGWQQPRYSVRAEDTLESLRRSVLAPPPAREVLARGAVGLAKSWR